ncbi:MAG TPA: iron ABC transporter permease, partial [Pseudolabrys sp.]|nr:iron ABC transporter permease [Pseudolabrys sp.]
MTIALPASSARRTFGLDMSKPVLMAFALILFALIAMPLSWLLFYAFSSKGGGFTLDNFHRLMSDAAYLDPLLTTFALATLSALICCAVAAPMGWLVAR